MSTHTKGPWKVIREGDKQGFRGISIQANNGEIVANIVMNLHDQEKANAALIVRAVNSYEELLEALEFIAEHFAGKDKVNSNAVVDDSGKTIYQVVHDALAKAEGRTP